MLKIVKGDLLEATENLICHQVKENDVIEELKSKVGKDDEVYYKKSGCGYFIVLKEANEDFVTFMSGVPIWWIGDEDLTNYYDDVEDLTKANLVEKINE